jgi:hypothetical protein
MSNEPPDMLVPSPGTLLLHTVPDAGVGAVYRIYLKDDYLEVVKTNADGSAERMEPQYPFAGGYEDILERAIILQATT